MPPLTLWLSHFDLCPSYLPQTLPRLTRAAEFASGMAKYSATDNNLVGVCVFITAGPMIKLCPGGEGDSEGHVL
jgi:hypothetical protein